MKPKMFRQGDVLIRKINRVPKGAKPVKLEGGRIVLAYGEATGHAHAIAVADPATDVDARLLALGDRRFLEVPSPTSIRHEEHGAIDLPTGNYEVTRQREYSPEEIRNVAD
jgi:hypothetical protein